MLPLLSELYVIVKAQQPWKFQGCLSSTRKLRLRTVACGGQGGGGSCPPGIFSTYLWNGTFCHRIGECSDPSPTAPWVLPQATALRLQNFMKISWLRDQRKPRASSYNSVFRYTNYNNWMCQSICPVNILTIELRRPVCICTQERITASKKY